VLKVLHDFTEGRFQLDVDVSKRLYDRGAVRAMAVLQRQRHRKGTTQGLRRQQDQGRRLVRVQLRSEKRTPRLCQRIAEIHSGDLLKRTLNKMIPNTDYCVEGTFQQNTFIDESS